MNVVEQFLLGGLVGVALGLLTVLVIGFALAVVHAIKEPHPKKILEPRHDPRRMARSDRPWTDEEIRNFAIGNPLLSSSEKSQWSQYLSITGDTPKYPDPQGK